jgi:hypothetical protein
VGCGWEARPPCEREPVQREREPALFRARTGFTNTSCSSSSEPNAGSLDLRISSRFRIETLHQIIFISHGSYIHFSSYLIIFPRDLPDRIHLCLTLSYFFAIFLIASTFASAKLITLFISFLRFFITNKFFSRLSNGVGAVLVPGRDRKLVSNSTIYHINLNHAFI